MAKQTKALSGPAKRKFFAGLVAAEPGVEPALARRLTDRLDAGVSQVRVRHHAAIARDTLEPSPPSQPPAPTPAAAAVAPPAAAPPFDPHAFSLVVVMSKQGAAGLLKRLEAIGDVAHLEAIATAQHIDVGTAAGDAAALRAAIVEGTARRIADRRAAAS